MPADEVAQRPSHGRHVERLAHGVAAPPAERRGRGTVPDRVAVELARCASRRGSKPSAASAAARTATSAGSFAFSARASVSASRRVSSVAAATCPSRVHARVGAPGAHHAHRASRDLRAAPPRASPAPCARPAPDSASRRSPCRRTRARGGTSASASTAKRCGHADRKRASAMRSALLAASRTGSTASQSRSPWAALGSRRTRPTSTSSSPIASRVVGPAGAGPARGRRRLVEALERTLRARARARSRARRWMPMPGEGRDAERGDGARARRRRERARSRARSRPSRALTPSASSGPLAGRQSNATPCVERPCLGRLLLVEERDGLGLERVHAGAARARRCLADASPRRARARGRARAAPSTRASASAAGAGAANERRGEQRRASSAAIRARPAGPRRALRHRPGEVDARDAAPGAPRRIQSSAASGGDAEEHQVEAAQRYPARSPPEARARATRPSSPSERSVAIGTQLLEREAPLARAARGAPRRARRSRPPRRRAAAGRRHRAAPRRSTTRSPIARQPSAGRLSPASSRSAVRWPSASTSRHRVAHRARGRARWPRLCSSSIATERIAASGFATSWPAMSGAEPCTGS